MIVSHDEYKKMTKLILQAIGEFRAISASDCEDELLDFDSVSSLYEQILNRTTKRESWKVDMSMIRTKILPRLYSRKETGSNETLLNIARELKVSSYRSVVKMVLEAVVEKSVEVKVFLEDPSIVGDPLLRRDLLVCLEEDPAVSTESDLYKELAGKEFEDLLLRELDSKGLCYETEEMLRMRGKPKTPDILFLIPMAVQLPASKSSTDKTVKSNALTKYSKPSSSSISNSSSNEEPIIVNWIDSKAMFADEETFKEHSEQLKGYYNRYGPGMVIYWHGCVESLQQREQDSIVVITDHFPQHWIYPTGELANGQPTEFDKMFETTGI